MQSSQLPLTGYLQTRRSPYTDTRSIDILDTIGYKNNSEFGECSYG
jgi:hypothetical protein